MDFLTIKSVDDVNWVVSTYTPKISTQTTAGVDFSTTSAIKLYLYLGLSGLKGEAQWAEGTTRGSHLLATEPGLSSSVSSLWPSQSAAPKSPKPTEAVWKSRELLRCPFFSSRPSGAALSRPVCPSASPWFHISACGRRLAVLPAKDSSPRLWRVCVLNVDRRHR